MITIGNSYILEVTKIVDFGAFLDAGELGEVLLPFKQGPSDLSLGDSIKVFLYLDSEDRPIATTLTPKAEVGQFAYLKVVATTDVGAFLDWGLDKDVLVPFAEQHVAMVLDHSYLVYLYLGKIDQRVTASSKIDKFIDEDPSHDFTARQAVDLIIANTTDLGFKAIINHSQWGLLYKNEVHERLSFGDSKQGFIKFVRPDGRIDLSLGLGQMARDKYTKTVLTYLNNNGGFAAIHDKSDPELIKKLLGMSKKSFKKTIGGLYKQRVIEIEKTGIRLMEK